MVVRSHQGVTILQRTLPLPALGRPTSAEGVPNQNPTSGPRESAGESPALSRGPEVNSGTRLQSSGSYSHVPGRKARAFRPHSLTPLYDGTLFYRGDYQGLYLDVQHRKAAAGGAYRQPSIRAE